MNEAELCKKFGENVRKFRKEKGWTQLDFAFELNEHPNRIGEMENGRRNLTFRKLAKVSQALGVEPKDLFNF